MRSGPTLPTMFLPTTPRLRSRSPRCLRSWRGSKLTGENFHYPWQVHVYQQAAKIGNVLYQLPCNCRCDRALGHTSLRSCYEGLHGTECSTCAKEAFYAYALTKAGQDARRDPRRHRADTTTSRSTWKSNK